MLKIECGGRYMLKIEVQSRVVGIYPKATPASIVLELLNETVTARELISRTVEEQIRDLITLRRFDTAQAHQMLDRQYLTETEIRHQAESGAIRYPSEREKQSLPIDGAQEC